VNYAFEDCLGVTEVDPKAIWKPLESLVVRCREKMQNVGVDDGFEYSGLGHARSSITDPFSTFIGTGFPSILFDGRDDASHLTSRSNHELDGIVNGIDESYPLPDDLMSYDIYEPPMTMDNFMAFNEGWWNAEI